MTTEIQVLLNTKKLINYFIVAPSFYFLLGSLLRWGREKRKILIKLSQLFAQSGQLDYQKLVIPHSCLSSSSLYC